MWLGESPQSFSLICEKWWEKGRNAVESKADSNTNEFSLSFLSFDFEEDWVGDMEVMNLINKLIFDIYLRFVLDYISFWYIL